MPHLPDLPVAIGRTAAMRCRMGRALPAVAWFENWAVSRIFYWPITTMPAMPNTVACSFAARAWLGETDRGAEDGVAYLRGQRCLIHRDARAWNLETDDAAPPICRESPRSG